MPRIADPQIGPHATKAALRLLDSGGLAKVTMRAVARAAHTTTATIYERFADRDQLLESVRREAELEVLEAVRQVRDVREFFNRCLEFYLEHPHRFAANAKTFGFRLGTGTAMPVYELLKQHLKNEVGAYGAMREQLALALVSLLQGTMRGILAAGSNTPAAEDLQRTSMNALQLLLVAFSSVQPSPDDAEEPPAEIMRRPSLCPVCSSAAINPAQRATLSDEKGSQSVEVLAYRCESGHVWINTLERGIPERQAMVS